MSAPVQAGDVLAGKYRVEQVLGSGGMGVVVRAVHVTLGQQLALKFLLPEACERPEAVARFLREARAAVQIQSEHVARVSDVGTLESGSPYMVMEFLRGRDLSAEIAARGSLPIAEAIDYILQASEAVAEAHSLGIVHRDLKPANLFLTRRADGSPLVKVLDFGISKLAADPQEVSLTSTQSTLGSPLYMSPEQVRSAKNVDLRTDVWSLGVILYELLAGAPPFRADTLGSVFAQIIADSPSPLRSDRPDVPPELEAAILHALEKDPARRAANVGELARSIVPFGPPRSKASLERIAGIMSQSGLDTSSLALPSLPPPATAASTTPTGGAWGTTNPGTSRSRLGGFVAGGVAAVVGIGAIVLLVHSRAPTAAPAAGLAVSVAAPPAAASVEAPSLQAPAPPADPAPAAPAASDAAPEASDAPAVASAPTRAGLHPSATSTKPGGAPVSHATAAKPRTPTRGGSVDPLDGRK